jgi:hypothetical protein
MKRRIVWVVLVLLVTGAAAGYLIFRDQLMEKPESAGTDTPTVAEPSEMIISELPPSSTMPESAVEKDMEIEDEIYTMFDVDKRGNLVLNAATRINIEKLTALNTPEELKEKLRKFSVVLPPEAYRQLVYLIEDFKGYIAAVKGAYPPDAEIETVEEALDEMEGIHALRVKYFGAKVAEAFFAEEDKLNRQLLQLMALEADENMTMEEKAHKAQQLIKSSPGLSDVNDPDRD